MAYNEEKLARLKHLKQLAQKAKAESDAVATRVKALEMSAHRPIRSRASR